MPTVILDAAIAVCQISLAQIGAIPTFFGQESKVGKETSSTSEVLTAADRSRMAASILMKGKAQPYPGCLAAAAEAADVLSCHSTHYHALMEAIETGVGLIPAVERTISDLTFHPRTEAESPAGFPGYTPVGVIETKSYPSYRQVQTQMGGMLGDQTAFFRLFNHIKDNEIAMTSPVPVERDAKGKKTMSFLYGDANIGEQKLNGKVKVLDVEPVTVVSIGMRYRESRRARNQALLLLKNWLEDNKSTWAAAGGWRTMGWNSPMVRGSKRYWEVQIPIRLRGSRSSSVKI